MEQSKKKTITAHCIVKNEENFVAFAIRSVIDFVDKVLVFDTGSTDKTVGIIKKLQAEYPLRIHFEEKGDCDKKRHTQLRQEMMNRTDTDWFMFLDGDEVHTQREMSEAVKMINESEGLNWLASPYYQCVGDVFHTYYNEKYYDFWERKGFFTVRFIRNDSNFEIRNNYEDDTIFYKNDGTSIFEKGTAVFLQNKYWHLTHLRRSTKDDECFTTGIEKTRARKRRLTYFVIGRKIKEDVPEVFLYPDRIRAMSFGESFLNFIYLFFMRRELILRWIKLVFFKKDYV